MQGHKHVISPVACQPALCHLTAQLQKNRNVAYLCAKEEEGLGISTGKCHVTVLILFFF